MNYLKLLQESFGLNLARMKARSKSPKKVGQTKLRLRHNRKNLYAVPPRVRKAARLRQKAARRANR